MNLRFLLKVLIYKTIYWLIIFSMIHLFIIRRIGNLFEITLFNENNAISANFSKYYIMNLQVN